MRKNLKTDVHACVPVSRKRDTSPALLLPDGIRPLSKACLSSRAVTYAVSYEIAIPLFLGRRFLSRAARSSRGREHLRGAARVASPPHPVPRRRTSRYELIRYDSNNSPHSYAGYRERAGVTRYYAVVCHKMTSVNRDQR